MAQEGDGPLGLIEWHAGKHFDGARHGGES
jgi:hypothetical protein